MKPFGNFNSSADAEVLYKAMKGLGKRRVSDVNTGSCDDSEACRSVVKGPCCLLESSFV